MKKKIYKILILFLVIIAALTTVSFAQDEFYLMEKTEAYEKWESLAAEQIVTTIEPRAYSISIKDSMLRSKYNDLLLGVIASDEAYNSAKSGTIKDQRRTGSCWAFSITSMLENNIAVTRNLFGQVYSPYHMDYVTYQMYNKVLGYGGNTNIAIAYLVNGRGPVFESDFKTDDVYNEIENSSSNYYLTDLANVADKLEQTAQLKVNETVEFPAIYKSRSGTNITYTDGNGTTYTTEQVNAVRTQIKNHIKTYGAVTAIMYIDVATNDGTTFYSSYYNSTTNLFCCTSNTTTSNHQVTIVGWDDTIGAYIVQNSYGTAFGDGGYFYVSYDDTHIEEWIYGITDLEQLTSDSYDNIYYYDELGMNNALGGGTEELYYANVFTRNACANDKDEYINEVGLYMYNTAGVEIYVNAKDGNLDSEFELVSSGEILETGYHVIRLNATDATKLTGDKFVIKVKAINEEGAVMPVELDYKASGLSSTSIYDKSTASLGESFISNDGTTWTDVNAIQMEVGYAVCTITDSNACVRAFTKYVNKSTDVAVEGVELDKDSITLVEGETENLTAKVLPEDATNQNIVWTSMNDAIATIENGVITAVKAGITTIMVATEEGGYTDSCEVIVEEPVINVTGVTLSPTSVEIEEEATATLTPTVSPSNATNQNITWTSSDESIAIVSDGVVTAKKAGTATITVKTEDGNYTATAQITVKTKTINVTGVTVTPTTSEIEEEETVTLTPTIAPSNATNKNITWESSNEGVATVSNGVVTGVGVGTATITVKTQDGNYTATAQITVKAKTINVTGVSLDRTNGTIKIEETLILTPTVSPSNATNKNITWESSNEGVATVSNGVVTGVSAGTATITVKTEDGNHTATCIVTVEENKPPVINVTGVTLNKTNEKLKIGETISLVPTINPGDATNKNITWTSSNENVATVANGVVTGVSAGTATITVKTEDGNYTAICNVTVEKNVINVTGVTLDKTNETLKIGETLTLVPTINPGDATNKNITWTSSNESVATVSSGVVTAVSEGTAEITITTEDGNYKATCNVTVEKNVINVTGVTLDKTNATLKIGKTISLMPTINPGDATNQNVTWTSSNENIATVSSGVVTAVSAGTVTITVKTEDGNHKATCTIIVEEDVVKVTEVTIGFDEITVQEGVTINLLEAIEILPANATNKNITFETSDPEIATVSNGVVTTLKPGTVTITVRTADGNFTDTCTITIEEKVDEDVKVESIKIDKEALQMQVAERATLIITFNPEFPTNSKIKWESSNTKVATVDENGIVTAVGKGKAVITATSEDGGHTANCTVTVTKQVEDPDDIYKQEDPTVTTKPIPNAGLKTMGYVMVVVIGVMGYSFIRYKKIRKYVK